MIKRGYYNNKQLWYENPYHEGRLHGIMKVWHRNGQLMYECPYHEGRPHGIVKYWYSDKEFDYKTHYLYGDKVTEKEYRKHELISKLSGL